MRTILALLLVSVKFTAHSQGLEIKNYSFGYKVYEIDAVGNSPLTIAPFLKYPGAYKDFISRVSYNGIYGNPGVQLQRNFYFNAEWKKDSTESRFWKKYRLETGLFLTNRIRKDNMALENQLFVMTSSDTTLYRDAFSLILKEQFAGVSVGINRRVKMFKSVVLVTGLHTQLNFAFEHYYRQRWDSSVYRNQSWTTKISDLPNLKGRHFFQWQMMIPVGLEVNAYKHQVYIRTELDLGVVNDRYRKWASSLRVANGYGISIIYQRPGQR